jgi:protein tyrosine phosphatase (PTP) superfamily phosphohydrolase (DUF442 family)
MADTDPQPSVSSRTSSSSKKRRRIITVVIALLIVGGAGLAYYVDHYLPYWHWRTVEKDGLYRSSQLDPEQLGEAIDKFGLKTIINLRDVPERTNGDWYEKQNEVVRGKGALVLDVPLKAGTPPNAEQVELILKVLDDPKNRPAMAHCYHGSIRSAALEGLYRREYMGESGAEANDNVESWGHDLSVKYPEIYKFIQDYVPRSQRSKGAAPVEPKKSE